MEKCKIYDFKVNQNLQKKQKKKQFDQSFMGPTPMKGKSAIFTFGTVTPCRSDVNYIMCPEPEVTCPLSLATILPSV